MPSLPPEGPGIIRDETGAQTLLGYVVDIRDDDGTARCWLDVGPQHGNRHGGLHGGVISCMIDNAMGYAAALSFGDGLQTRVHTLSMVTNFIAPASGGVVQAVGRVSGGGRGTAFTEGEVLDAEGRVLATGSGVYKRVRDATG